MPKRTIYTVTNTQHIRIYPGKLKSFLIKFHLIQDVNMADMPKKIKLYSRFLTLYGMGGGGVESTPPGSFLLITLKRLNGFE